MGEIAVMNHEGDTTITWSPDRPEEVEAAQRMWNTLVGGKGYAAFALGEDDKRGRRLRSFDPQAQKVLLIPPMAGGA